MRGGVGGRVAAIREVGVSLLFAMTSFQQSYRSVIAGTGSLAFSYWIPPEKPSFDISGKQNKLVQASDLL
jgi:hypothetical protein